MTERLATRSNTRSMRAICGVSGLIAVILGAGCATSSRVVDLTAVREPELVVAHVVEGPRLIDSTAAVNAGFMAAIYEVQVSVDYVVAGHAAVREGEQFTTRLMAGNSGSLQVGAQFMILIDPQIINGGGFRLLHWRPLETFACIAKKEIESSGLDIADTAALEHGGDVCLR